MSASLSDYLSMEGNQIDNCHYVYFRRQLYKRQYFLSENKQMNGHLMLFLFGSLLILVLTGCASTIKRNPAPIQLSLSREIHGITNARHWGDDAPQFFKEWLSGPFDDLELKYSGIMGKEHSYLAISGGGADGAFGAGLLVGWTAAGTRPEFTVVTGISTGALTAPFAFLGSDYDDQLEEVYTTYSTKDLIKSRSLFDMISGDSFAETSPLEMLIAKYIDEEVMHALAKEYRKGRQLDIGTTNLDAMRPVTWNITRIADSGHPKALELIRQILLASASIPVFFSPVYINIEDGDQVFDEMHVDGGATSQVYFYPANMDMLTVKKRLKVKGEPNLYVIRNAWLEPDWKAVEPSLPSIAGRTVSSLTRTQGIGDVYKLYFLTQRDSMNFNLAYIPSDVENESQETFDPIFMKKLFDLGYQMGKSGYPWEKTPPGFTFN